MSKTSNHAIKKKSFFQRLGSVLFVALLIISAIFYYRQKSTSIISVSQAPTINILESATTKYGPSTIEGVIEYGPNKSFILVTSDMRAILLDSQGIDSLIGAKVGIEGILFPAINPDNPMYMKVSKIIVAPY